MGVMYYIEKRDAMLRRSIIFVGRCASACIAPIYDLELQRSKISNNAYKDGAPTALAGRVCVGKIQAFHTCLQRFCPAGAKNEATPTTSLRNAIALKQTR